MRGSPKFLNPENSPINSRVLRLITGQEWSLQLSSQQRQDLIKKFIGFCNPENSPLRKLIFDYYYDQLLLRV